MVRLILNREEKSSERLYRDRIHDRSIGLIRLGLAALLLSAAACQGGQTGDPPDAATPIVADVAALVATSVAATLAAQPSPAPPTLALTPARHPLVGRWYHTHAEEEINYVQMYEFFADGLYTMQVEGAVSYCYLFPGFPGCELAPNMPIQESASGTYEFLSDTQVRLRDTTGLLSAFTIVDLSPSRLVMLENGEQRLYERRP